LHYQLFDDWDTYIGVMLGYNVVISSSFGSGVNWNNNATVGSGLTSFWFIGGVTILAKIWQECSSWDMVLLI